MLVAGTTMALGLSNPYIDAALLSIGLYMAADYIGRTAADIIYEATHKEVKETEIHDTHSHGGEKPHAHDIEIHTNPKTGEKFPKRTSRPLTPEERRAYEQGKGE
jgi:hypothetical protein